MVAILIISVKLATLGLLKINLFWNKGYDVILFLTVLTNKFFSSGSTYIVDVVKWPKLGDSRISLRKVIITSIL